MSRSIKEEVIGCLWLIICLLCIQNDIIWAAWITGIKGIGDHLTSIVYAIREAIAERVEATKP